MNAMKKVLISIAVVFTALAWATTGPALASPVTIGNPSFETPARGDGGAFPTPFDATLYSWGSVAPLGGAVAAYIANPSSAVFTAVPDGNQALELVYGYGGGEVYQGVGTIQVNTNYTLTFYVGNPLPGSTSVKGYTVALYDATASLTLASQTHIYNGFDNFSPANGEWELSTVTYTSTNLTAGHNLQILFYGPGGNGDNVYFDKIQLDASGTSQVPLPGAVWLLGSGLLGLMGLRRFRKI
jgi:hypothetical protein